MNNNFGYRNAEERRRGLIDTYSKKYYGLFKADFNAEYIESDYGYFKVYFRGFELTARPVYVMGGMVMLPSKEWLQKFSSEIYFMISFEEGDIHKCLFHGWCFKENASATAISSIENSSTFRSIHFTERFDDIQKNHTIEYKESENDTDGFFHSFGIDGLLGKFKKVFLETIESFTIKVKSFTVTSDDIRLSTDASEPAVKGTTLNSNLEGILTDIATGLTSLSTTLTALSVTAAATPTTSTLASGLGSAAQDAANLSAKMSKNISNLANQLNKKILV